MSKLEKPTSFSSLDPSLGRRSKLKFEGRVTILSLAAGLPAVALCAFLLWYDGYSAQVQWTVDLLLVLDPAETAIENRIPRKTTRKSALANHRSRSARYSASTSPAARTTSRLRQPTLRRCRTSRRPRLGGELSALGSTESERERGVLPTSRVESAMR